MTLRLNSSGGGYVEQDAPNISGNYTLTLPTSAGSANQVLQTDGSGTLSFTYTYGPSFRAKLSSNQSISDATWTTAVLNSEDWDSDSLFDTSTGRFTPNKAGIYFINAQTYLNYSGGSPTRYGVRIYKNGGWFAGDVTTSPANSWGMATISTLVNFNGTTDYVDMRAYFQGATSGQEMLSGYTNMSGVYLRPLA